MSGHSVLVVGGGIGGLSFAVAARRQGLKVDVIELSPKVLGMGIFLTGSTLRALDSIGLAHQCTKEGWPATAIRLFNSDGKLMDENPFAKIAAQDLPAASGIRRPMLAGILATAAEEAGARTRVGLTIDALEQDADGVTVTLSDGSTGRYDAVVGADGIYSRVRELVFGAHLKPSHSGQGGWRFMTSRPAAVDTMFLYLHGPLKAGFAPLDKDSMYLFVTVADPDKAHFDPARTPEIFRELLSPFKAPLIAEMRERLLTADPATVMWRPFETLLVAEPWNQGRVVLIGDAAHSMSPHLSSGGGMAIEDAVVLAQHLGGDRPVVDALSDFYGQRSGRVGLIQGISTAICQEETAERPSHQCIYRLTTEGYAALATPFMEETAHMQRRQSARVS